MSTSELSKIRTRMFARVMGPFFAIVPTAIAIRGAYMRTLLSEFQSNPMWPWLFGAVLLIWSLIILAFHQYWRSPAAVIISLVGWIFGIRAVILLVVPQAYIAAGNALAGHGRYSALVYVVFIVLAIAGLYLTYVGWLTARNGRRSTSAAAQNPTGAR